MEEMEFLALEAYAHLPEDFRKLTGEIVIQIAEFPTDEIMDDLSLETPFDLLGLFEGRGIAERWNPQTGEGPNRITLYRRAILDYWAENEETLGDIVTHVLIHEIGHHFGLSDDDMEKIEEAANDGRLMARNSAASHSFAPPSACRPSPPRKDAPLSTFFENRSIPAGGDVRRTRGTALQPQKRPRATYQSLSLVSGPYSWPSTSFTTAWPQRMVLASLVVGIGRRAEQVPALVQRRGHLVAEAGIVRSGQKAVEFHFSSLS